ncbi:UNVERIFIED_CONTAM: hypothetical protein FKN15_021117 [Acipenser sinensis]
MECCARPRSRSRWPQSCVSYLDGVLRETPLPEPVASELRLLSNTLLQISGLQGQALGRSLAGLIVAHRQLWLSQARVHDADKAALLDAPISTGHTFGPAVEETVTLVPSKRRRPPTMRSLQSPSWVRWKKREIFCGFIPSVSGTKCVITGRGLRQLWYRQLNITYLMGRNIPYIMLVVVFSFREPGLWMGVLYLVYSSNIKEKKEVCKK